MAILGTRRGLLAVVGQVVLAQVVIEIARIDAQQARRFLAYSLGPTLGFLQQDLFVAIHHGAQVQVALALGGEG